MKPALAEFDHGATLAELDRLDCEQDHLEFVTKFFAAKEGQAFQVGPHHAVMARTLDRVISGEITRLIINVPPGYTKTEMAVVHFIARGLAINPRARFPSAGHLLDDDPPGGACGCSEVIFGHPEGGSLNVS